MASYKPIIDSKKLPKERVGMQQQHTYLAKCDS